MYVVCGLYDYILHITPGGQETHTKCIASLSGRAVHDVQGELRGPDRQRPVRGIQHGPHRAHLGNIRYEMRTTELDTCVTFFCQKGLLRVAARIINAHLRVVFFLSRLQLHHSHRG